MQKKFFGIGTKGERGEKMRELTEETVHIENMGIEIRYGFLVGNVDGKEVYGLSAGLCENGSPITKAEVSIGDDIAKAIKLYGILIKHKVTPIDLEYVIEDLV